jgi:putative flippase GtrA
MGSGSRRAKLGLIFRFGLAGAANTAVGFLAIAVLDVGLHLPPALANAIGFALGIVLSFTLNRSFVFRSNLALHTSGPRFLLVVAIAFALNQAVLALAGRVLGATPGGHIAAQLAGMSIYTLVVFVLCRIWIFRTGEPVEKNSAK